MQVISHLRLPRPDIQHKLSDWNPVFSVQHHEILGHPIHHIRFVSGLNLQMKQKPITDSVCDFFQEIRFSFLGVLDVVGDFFGFGNVDFQNGLDKPRNSSFHVLPKNFVVLVGLWLMGHARKKRQNRDS